MASNTTCSPHPPHTAGPSTASSSTTSPTGTHSTVATTVGNRQRSWDEDKHLHLYILDYCRRRKFEETALAFEREARVSPDTKINFDAPQGLLFEWWIVFWETFNSQRSQMASPPGQGESSQVYVNTMSRLRKLAMHEKDEQNRPRAMSMSMAAPGMPNPMMGGMPPAMNGSGSASAMSTPAMSNLPNPMGGVRPPSQASARMPQQPGMGQPGQPPMGPGASGPPGMPQQQGMGPAQINGPPQQGQPGMGQQRPQQPGMGMPPSGMQMTPNMTHASTPHASTPSAPHVSSSPSPVPTPPQTFPGGAPGPQQPQFNPQFNPSQSQFSGPGQPPFPGQPGQFSGGPGNQQQFRPGPGQTGPPGQNPQFAPGGSGPGFQPGAGQNFPPGFQPGPGNAPGPQQPFQPGPGGQFSGGPGGPGGPGPGPNGQFPPGVRPGPGLGFQNNNQPPEWAQRPPTMGPGGPEQGRRPDGSWEDGRPRPGMMGQQPKMGASHPGMQQYLGRPGGPPPHMMGQPGMGGPQQMGGGPIPSPKDDNRSVTPQQTQAGWNPDSVNMQRRAGMAAQGGQMGPRPGFNPQAQGPGAQKRPGSPPPLATTSNLGGSPPDPKRPRPNDPGPGVLVDSRAGADGRPTSSKGGVPFPGQGQGMNGQPANTQARLNGEQQYSQELRGATAEMRSSILRQGGPQPPPFTGKGPQNGANPRGSRPHDAPSPASGGEGPGPRQVANIKGQASNSMGPPASPGLANRNLGGVKKSESAGSSPALAHMAAPNGMNPGDRSQTPQQIKQGDSHSPMPAPMTRPQSAQPMMNQGPSVGVPAPPGSAPPMLPPTQSPSNGILPFSNKFDNHFDFGGDVDFANLTNEFFPDMVDPMLGLDGWPDAE